MKLIVGLGNPGVQYVNTRHNAGFMVVDALANEWGIEISKTKEKALVGEGRVNTEKVILVKPQTYMNLSGQSVIPLLHWYKLKPEEMIIIYDDLDLDLGTIRLRGQGSAGGHNGMKSIIALLGSSDFPRLRFGIGRPDRGQVVDYVLGNFSKDEQEKLDEQLNKACSAVECWLEEELTIAMNKFNK